ncbi:MAG: ABC transporter substrate-binding protein [Coriobacteriales bacterium]|nr:ABC transporter substrate-binding protein [Coriobacteriales bacterium]
MDSTSITRRKFISAVGAGALGLSLGGILQGCAGGTQDADSPDAAGDDGTNGASAKGVIVVMGTGSEPAAGFDPFANWGCAEHMHEPLIQSTLITTTTDMGFVNDLADSYESSKDGLTWTFIIRADVKFTDGEPLTAQDVAYTINGIKASPISETDFSMMREAEAPDATTVVIHMVRPYNALLYLLAVVGIVPEHAHGSDYGSKPIGSGRYLLEQWDQGQQVIFVANPDYYGSPVKMERVTVLFMEEDAALAAARSGQVDVAYTSAVYSGQQLDGYGLLACKSVDSRGISLPTVEPGGTKSDGETEYPTGNAVTSALEIRRALNSAVDRQALVDNVLNGYGSLAYSVCDGMPWASPDMKVTQDVAGAQALLEGAGWVAGADGIREKNGVRATFELYYPANDSVRQGLASEFSNQVRAIGVEVKVQGAGWSDLYPHQFTDPILWGWGSNSPTELYNLNYSTGSGNFAGYQNSSTDGYLDAALATPNLADSYKLWQNAQWDGATGTAPQGAATWVWLASIDHLYFTRDGLEVAEQKLHPHGHGWSVVNNVDQWSWK